MKYKKNINKNINFNYQADIIFYKYIYVNILC